MSGCRKLQMMVVLGATTLLALAQEDALERFSSIPQRNAFGLKPPPPPAEQKVMPPPPPAVTVKLTGIISLLTNKKAILLVTEQGKPAESKVLGENQSEGPVEVKEIDPVASIVKVIVSGKDTELNFEKDGVKPPSGGGTGLGGPTIGFPAGAGAGSTTAKQTAAALFSSAASASASAPGNIGGGSLASYLSRASSAASTSANTMTPIASSTAGIASPVAGQTFRFNPNGGNANMQPNWPPRVEVNSQEESALHLLLNEQINQEAIKRTGKPLMPPMPPIMETPSVPGTPPIPGN